MTATAVPQAPAPYLPAGNTAPRLNRWKIVLFAIVGLGIVVGVANVVLLINEPGTAAPDCRPNRPCIPPGTVAAVSLGTRWVSRDLGYSFEYPPDWLRVASEDGSGVRLQIPTDRVQSEIWISGVPADETSLDALVQQRRDELAQRVVGLEADNSSADRVVSPSLGFVRGAGGAYAGTLDTSSGPTVPASVAIMAAGDGKVNVVMSWLVAGQGLNHKTIEGLRIATARLIVDTVRWR